MPDHETYALSLQVGGRALTNDGELARAIVRALPLDAASERLSQTAPLVVVLPDGSSEEASGPGEPHVTRVALEERGMAELGVTLAVMTEHDPVLAIAELFAESLVAGGLHLVDLLRPGDDEETVRELVADREGAVLVLRWRPVPVEAALPPVYLRTPVTPLFVGGWARVPVVVRAGSGIAFDDLDFAVVEGVDRGLLSPSRDATFDPAAPDVMLLAGDVPGRGTLRATHRPTGKVVAEAPFDVTAYWPDDRSGPTFWVSGLVDKYVSGAWGGGPGGVQNYDVKPRSGAWRVAILLVDTKSQRFTSDAPSLASIKKKWKDETVDGVTVGGTKRSTAAYYREVSGNALQIAADVYGPVSMPKEIDDYLEKDDASKSTFDQAVVTKAAKLIDYTKVDSLVMVIQSRDAKPATGTTPAVKRRGVWPTGWGQTYAAQGKKIRFGMIAMPTDWGVAAGGNRHIHETLAHEIGHNLGMGDQYSPSVPMPNPPPNKRNLGNWELMDYERNLPHLTLFHRLLLGWIEPKWVEAIDFSTAPVPYQKTFKLSPIEKRTPPAGHRAGLEIRIGDGLNWYVEYRVGQTGHIGDQSLPKNQRVLVTEAVSNDYKAPISRPAILRVANDLDKDGSELDQGDDYESRDFTGPNSPPFELKVIKADAGAAEVRVSYGITGRPDPSIRPWPAGPGRQWQSPDIEVTNAKSKADPTWKNVPWLGNPNTVTARVKNGGGVDAPGVRVDFYVKNFNIGNAPEHYIGSDVKSVPKGKTVTFTCSTTWTPPQKGHYCVVARIPLYQVPTALSVVELTERNNEAQSNYTRFISKKASAPSRELTAVEVGNPYDVPARVLIHAGQTNPVYRTYLEHKWLRLDPREVRTVGVMLEYAPDEADRMDLPLDDFAEIPNDVDIVGFIDDAREVVPDSVTVMGGVDIQVEQGWATRFSDPDPSDEVLHGRVLVVADSSPVPGGTVLAAVRVGGSSRARIISAAVANGAFELPLPRRWESARLEYVPIHGYGECAAEVER